MKYSIFDAMNFKPLRLLFFSAIISIFYSCQPAPAPKDPRGDVQVQVPLIEESGHSSESDHLTFRLKNVILKNINSLREMKGLYAEFFYSPGLLNGRLTGQAPKTNFIQTDQKIYVAQDQISLQLVTLYYHLQNLIEFASQLGITTALPFQVGVNTKIKADSSFQSNNAFFDGRSGAMLFVPYTAKDLPLTVNAGIVAHEFFHSIFYQKVLEPMHRQRKKIQQNISDLTVHHHEGWSNEDLDNNSKKFPIRVVQTNEELFNETYLRGINEGLADFWAWAYTNDPDFLKWSLVSYSERRSLKNKSLTAYQSEKDIEKAVRYARQASDDPQQILTQFIYEIGTPYARFLKNLTQSLSKNKNIELHQAKSIVSRFVIQFVTEVGQKVPDLKINDRLSVIDLFLTAQNYPDFSDSLPVCELVTDYLNSAQLETGKIYQCQKNESSSDSRPVTYKVIEL